MAITFLSTTSVSVTTYSDLRTVLTNAGNVYAIVTQVFLAADITLTGGILISRTVPSITIDGTDPVTGVRHVVTDTNSSDYNMTIGVRDNGGIAMSITFQNMTWMGYNYYGAYCSPDSTAYANISVNFVSFNYTGPQMVYLAVGTVRIIDCTVQIVRTSTVCVPQEIGEVCILEIGGNTSLTHTDPDDHDSGFWFRGTTPSFTILENAVVTIVSMFDVSYSEMLIPFTVRAGASLTVTTSQGMCRNDGRSFSNVTIGENASLSITQAAAYSGICTLYCGGTFSVAAGASVLIQTQASGAAALLQFRSTSPSLVLNNPKSFVLYHATAAAMSLASSTSLSITGGQVNHWRTATALPAAGGLTDIPADSWRKADGTLVTLSGTATSASTTLTSNLTASELTGKPLNRLQFNLERVFSVGNLPITLDPVTDDGAPITGQTLPGANVGIAYAGFSTTVVADDQGGYQAATPDVIPLETAVTATANVPFLLSYATQATQDPGVLEILDPPATIDFHFSVVAQTPVTLYGRVDPNWSLTVRDTRVRSAPWALLATITEPLTSTQNPEHALPDELVYVDETGAVTALSDTPTAIYTGPANGGAELQTTVSWAADKGLLLQSTSTPIFANERYVTPIQWDLGDA